MKNKQKRGTGKILCHKNISTIKKVGSKNILSHKKKHPKKGAGGKKRRQKGSPPSEVEQKLVTGSGAPSLHWILRSLDKRWTSNTYQSIITPFTIIPTMTMSQGDRVQQVAGILERQERGTSRHLLHLLLSWKTLIGMSLFYIASPSSSPMDKTLMEMRIIFGLRYCCQKMHFRISFLFFWWNLDGDITMLFDIKNLPEAADIPTLYFHYYHHHLLFLKGKPGPTKSDDLFYFCQTGVYRPPPPPYFVD